MNDRRMNFFVFIILVSALKFSEGQQIPRPINQPVPSSIPEVDGSLISYIHGKGVVGYVHIQPDNVQGKSTIRAFLTGGRRNEQFSWKIYSLPRPLNSFDCSPLSVGVMERDLTSYFGLLTQNKELSFPANLNLVEQPEFSLLGKTLLLTGVESGIKVCSTILPANKKKVLSAKFHHPISGGIKIIQTNLVQGVYAENMMYSDGSRKDSNLKWAIIKGVGDNSVDTLFDHEKTHCKNLQGDIIYSSEVAPEGEPIPISTEMPSIKGRSYRTVKLAQQINGNVPVFIVLYDEVKSNEIKACAPIVEVKPKKAVVKLNTDEVRGQINLVQESPFDHTVIMMNVAFGTNAYSYGIDVLPTIKRRKNEIRKCPNVKETIYNPFHTDPEDVPLPGLGTTDQYAVGDMSGKFGNLEGKNSERSVYYDFNIKLYGPFGVIGRALVFYTPSGPALTCANIELLNKNMTTVYSTFDTPFQGQFIYRQPSDDCFSETFIYIEISKAENTATTAPGSPIVKAEKSFNHPWHIHVNQVNAGFEHLSSSDCGPAGPHLNSYNTSTECLYVRDCTFYNPYRCEVGDASNKLGTIDIPVYKTTSHGEPDVAKYFFIDEDLTTCGTKLTIINRSIVIHDKDFGGPRVTCANLLKYTPK